MPVIRDDSLQDHARTIRSSYDAHAEALAELSEPPVVTRGLPTDPWEELPDEVADVKEEYEADLNVRLKFLKYVRTRNGELEEAVDSGEPMPADPVQLSRAITVSSSQGAVVFLEQWLAEALPADDQSVAEEG